MLRRLIVSVVLVVAACNKKSEIDCTRYAEHLADINTRGLAGSDREAPRRTVRAASEQACHAGRVPAAEVTCVMSASSAEQARECAGLPPLTAPPTPTAARVKTKGISIAVAPGWSIAKVSDARDGELTIREDKPDTASHIAGGAFVSRGPAKVATTETECATKGGNMARPGVKLRSTRWGTTKFGATCYVELNDDRMVILGQSIGVGNGEAITFNCYHDINDAGPSPACAEMFASIELE